MSKIHYKVEHCAIVILAAGISNRLGSPKQLLTFNGESLVKHSVNAALKTKMRPVIVVAGANNEAVKKELKGMEIEIADNENWQEGIASSIRCGLSHAQKLNDALNGIIFMVCDQPFITTKLLESLLMKQYETGLPIVASSYGNTTGVPALFHKIYFQELMELKGDSGARKLIKEHGDMVASVDFPKGIIDIDTKKDYEDLLK